MIEITSGHDGQISLKGFSQEDLEKMEGCILGGHSWMRVVDGEPRFVKSYKPLPDPIEDKHMLPFWRQSTEEEEKHPINHELFNHESFGDYESPSILIRYLCPRNYSSERYLQVAERLESFGFQCMRSRRGDDGKYWEIWFLPGLFMAKGELKELVSGNADYKDKLKKVLEFIRTDRSVYFGTLDVSVQRLAIPNPD